MAKPQTSYHCQSCGFAAAKWTGKCDGCGAWNSLVEEKIEQKPGIGKSKAGRMMALESLTPKEPQKPVIRQKSAMDEFERVMGGGIVPGSAPLIGGDPGIGKSTLLLQLVCQLVSNGHQTAYVSGEESADQVRMRAQRLGLGHTDVGLATATNAMDIAETIRREPNLDVVIIDSIQTMYLPGLESAPGTVSQVRASAQELTRAAKTSGAAVIFVGHVTKDGAIAGPRVLEHMVDTVL